MVDNYSHWFTKKNDKSSFFMMLQYGECRGATNKLETSKMKCIDETKSLSSVRWMET